MATAQKTGNKETILITGGAGFIGINAARHFIKSGSDVVIFDNFSRKGTEVNVKLLKKDIVGYRNKFGMTVVDC